MITEKLLFAVHEGSVGNRRAGIIMSEHCLPIACSHGSWKGKDGDLPHAEAGICACWESLTNAEEFFAALGFGSGIEAGYGSGERPNGLYVYEVEYDDEGEMPDYEDLGDDEWPWLEGGTLRRPTVDELEPLTRGEAPWKGVVL
jgi:hypothetical protein